MTVEVSCKSENFANGNCVIRGDSKEILIGGNKNLVEGSLTFPGVEMAHMAAFDSF